MKLIKFQDDPSGRCNLPLEPGEAIRISREGIGYDLQRDLAVELCVVGHPDLAHAPLAEERGDVLVPEAGTGSQRHDLG